MHSLFWRHKTYHVLGMWHSLSITWKWRKKNNRKRGFLKIQMAIEVPLPENIAHNMLVKDKYENLSTGASWEDEGLTDEHLSYEREHQRDADSSPASKFKFSSSTNYSYIQSTWHFHWNHDIEGLVVINYFILILWFYINVIIYVTFYHIISTVFLSQHLMGLLIIPISVKT